MSERTMDSQSPLKNILVPWKNDRQSILTVIGWYFVTVHVLNHVRWMQRSRTYGPHGILSYCGRTRTQLTQTLPLSFSVALLTVDWHFLETRRILVAQAPYVGLEFYLTFHCLLISTEAFSISRCHGLPWTQPAHPFIPIQWHCWHFAAFCSGGRG